MDFGSLFGVAAIVGGLALLTSLRILFEYQRGVVFRLGRPTSAKGPGLIPIVEAGERFKALEGGTGSPGDPSKTLRAASSGNALPASVDIPIPSGLDPQMLTEAAKALLGISAGESFVWRASRAVHSGG
jgi:regulator of protease activity HflC (stomatin/prohibitin superfamily)